MSNRAEPANHATPNALDIVKVCVPALSAVIAALAADPGGKQGIALSVVFWIALGVLAVTMIWAPFEYLAAPYVGAVIRRRIEAQTAKQRGRQAETWACHIRNAIPIWMAAARRTKSIDDIDEAYRAEREWLMRHEQDRPKGLGALFSQRLRERFPRQSWFEAECDNQENPFRPCYRADHALRLSAMMLINGNTAYTTYSAPRPELTLRLLWDVLVERFARDGLQELPSFDEITSDALPQERVARAALSP